MCRPVCYKRLSYLTQGAQEGFITLIKSFDIRSCSMEQKHRSLLTTRSWTYPAADTPPGESRQGKPAFISLSDIGNNQHTLWCHANPTTYGDWGCSCVSMEPSDACGLTDARTCYNSCGAFILAQGDSAGSSYYYTWTDWKTKQWRVEHHHITHSHKISCHKRRAYQDRHKTHSFSWFRTCKVTCKMLMVAMPIFQPLWTKPVAHLLTTLT